MRLRNEVALAADPETVFGLLNDVERVAPCLPGATLEGKDGEDSYRGRVKVKVGPITAAYSGTVRFLETDGAAGRLVLDARGSDVHGSGTAEAKVTVEVRGDGDGSVLGIDTDLVISGKVAQFGGGAISQVSQKLMEQFAANLSRQLAQPAASATTGTAGAAVPEPAAVDAGQQGSSLDVFSLVPAPVKRYAPTLGALALGLLAGRLLRPRRGGVLVDEHASAVVTVGTHRYRVPVRHVIRSLR